MNWDNLLSLFRMENLVYWIVTMVVVILTTIKQFNRQEQKNKTNNDEILTNLQTIEKQNIKMLNLLEMHSRQHTYIKLWLLPRHTEVQMILHHLLLTTEHQRFQIFLVQH